MTHDDSAALLGPDGPFAREVPHFAPRAAQQAMAAAVEEALANSGRASTLKHQLVRYSTSRSLQLLSSSKPPRAVGVKVR